MFLSPTLLGTFQHLSLKFLFAGNPFLLRALAAGCHVQVELISGNSGWRDPRAWAICELHLDKVVHLPLKKGVSGTSTLRCGFDDFLFRNGHHLLVLHYFIDYLDFPASSSHE
jgi:hypothetical protein